MLEDTQPTHPLADLQAIRRQPSIRQSKPAARGRRGCFWPVALLIAVLLYFFAPLRTNILLLGTDDSPQRGALGRTDTIILTTVSPLVPYIGMLSIPRDLWVSVPNVGEQRINTAYFFAEAGRRGSGGTAATQTIQDDFGVPVQYYAVIHMFGLVSAVDQLGGVDVQLSSPTADLPPGTHHLDGVQALAFVRERSTGDDFGRMQRTQILLNSALGKALWPSSWESLPEFFIAISQVIDTNIPVWQWPRLLFALMRSPMFGIDSRTITREMVTPFETSQGAQVLAPNWDAIRPVTRQMFGD